MKKVFVAIIKICINDVILAMRRLAILISKSSPALAVRPHYICAARNDCYRLHQQIRAQQLGKRLARAVVIGRVRAERRRDDHLARLAAELVDREIMRRGTPQWRVMFTVTKDAMKQHNGRLVVLERVVERLRARVHLGGRGRCR